MDMSSLHLGRRLGWPWTNREPECIGSKHCAIKMARFQPMSKPKQVFRCLFDGQNPARKTSRLASPRDVVQSHAAV
jgi:hypothetical protein